MSVHGGVPLPGGVLHPGGFSILGGVLHPGGEVPPSRGGSPSGQCAGGTHPTGIHSCSVCVHAFLNNDNYLVCLLLYLSRSVNLGLFRTKEISVNTQI